MNQNQNSLLSSYQKHYMQKTAYNNDSNFGFYEQYKKLLVTDYDLYRRFHELMDIKNKLSTKLQSLEREIETVKLQKPSFPEDRKKRPRRSATQISRNYACTMQHCDRSYGSQASLAQHVKLKHPDFHYAKKSKEQQDKDDQQSNTPIKQQNGSEEENQEDQEFSQTPEKDEKIDS